MDSPQDLNKILETSARWRDKQDASSQRKPEFKTPSQVTVDQVYTPENNASNSYLADQGMPGEFPYLRGVHASGYRGRLWTMRMFAGFGRPEETNARFKFLLEQGQTGLSVAFDMPTLYGYDTDDPRGAGEFGTCGVAVSSLADMETLFDGKQGVSLDRLGGTIQNDILKEYIAQNEYIFPPDPSVRLVVDTVEFGTKHIPRWNPISISGYHIREAGSNAIQELAFTLADGFEYVRQTLDRGLKIDDFAPRLSFFFNSHNNFFEEVGKFRAARRIWARVMQDTFGAKDPKSHQLRFHAQTSGQTLTAQQPENNVVRVSFQAMAAVLGGCQSLHTNGKDEAWALPSEEAALQALRTQQIIAHETGITDTVDPLGGSYFLETMTDTMEAASHEYFQRIDDLGGVIPALETGFLQREIADASYLYQLEEDRRERITVGVNEYRTGEGTEIPLLRVDREGEKKQIESLNEVRRTRDNREVSQRLKALEQAAKGAENTMPYLVEAAKSYATLGEMMDVFRDVFGEYNPSWGY